jgi:hypothetical protein
MHFATLIPDWNSLDSVRRAHSDLEAAALVFFALLVLFDILAHLSTDDKKKTLLEKIALYCFAIAVLAEVVAYPYGQRNDILSGRVIGSLDAETREALIKSGTALVQSQEAESKSGDAIDKAGKAQESLGNAENEANRAQRASSSALGIANDAKQVSRETRQEADTFEQDIKSAKTQAAEAESHLKEARDQAAQAEREAQAEQLARIKLQKQLAWRTLSADQRKRIGFRIRPFVAQQYNFVTYGTEPECINFQNELGVVTGRYWRIDPNRKWSMLMGLVVGIEVQVSDSADTQTNEASLALVDALNAEDILANRKIVPSADAPNPAVITITIGRNPNTIRPIEP